MVTAQASGKLFLLGEHAVVYVHPALIAAINKQLFVTSTINNKNTDEIITPGVSDIRFIREALSIFKKKFTITQSVQITTRSDFTDKVGFGSSAAVTVATIASLNTLFDTKLSNNDIFNLSYDVVRSVQSVASGADIAASVYGGIVYYKKTEPPIINKINTSEFAFIVGYSGIKADTVTMIKKVSNLYEEKKEFVEEIFADISDLVENGVLYLKQKDYEQFGICMNENHVLLQKLGVSTEKLDAMVLAAQNNGAWGAKLSGAGGGDCMIAIGPTAKKQKIEQAIRDVGEEIIKVSISSNGFKTI